MMSVEDLLKQETERKEYEIVGISIPFRQQIAVPLPKCKIKPYSFVGFLDYNTDTFISTHIHNFQM